MASVCTLVVVFRQFPKIRGSKLDPNSRGLIMWTPKIGPPCFWNLPCCGGVGLIAGAPVRASPFSLLALDCAEPCQSKDDLLGGCAFEASP